MVGETSAGKLVVEIVGDIAGLTRAYEEAKKQTEGFEGDLKIHRVADDEHRL